MATNRNLAIDHEATSAGANPADRRRATVSAVLIVKNEEVHIARCLDALDWVDEIIVVDSGSTDRTVELAKARGAKVAVRTDWAGFGIQRQRAQALATGDYIFSIDADEVVTPELRASIEAALERRAPNTVYEVLEYDWFLATFLDRNWRKQTHVRLYARDEFQFNSNLVHESVETRDAEVRRLGGILRHYTCLDYHTFLQKHVKYAHAWASDRVKPGKRPSLSAAVVHAIWTFTRMYVLQGGFLDGAYGFLFAVNLSQYVFNKHAALWHYSRSQADAVSEPQKAADAPIRKSAA